MWINSDEEWRDFQRTLNLLQARIWHSVFQRSECPCGQPLMNHCLRCGACGGGECDDSHLARPKYGFSPYIDVLGAEIVYEDILDCEYFDE